MSLALSTLIYEWRRYMAAIVTLAFAGVLMLALTGLFVGILSSFTASVDRARGELMILPAEASSWAGQSSVPARVLPLIYRHPDVVEVRDVPGDWGSFYGPGATKPQQVSINGVDTEPGAITLPQDFSDETRLALATPYNVVVDRTSLGSLKVKLGDMAVMNGRTVRVAGIIEGYANTQAANVFVSRATLRLMGRLPADPLGPLLVRLKPGVDPFKVRDELNAMAKKQYRAWEKKELSEATLKDVMKEGILALILGFMSVVGFVIGVVITWQTLRGAILANIKEFASLRALGVSLGSLRWVVMELSFWVGVAGAAMSGIFLVVITMAASAFNIPMAFPPAEVIQTIVLLLVIAIGSGMLTLGALKKGQPADLLK